MTNQSTAHSGATASPMMSLLEDHDIAKSIPAAGDVVKARVISVSKHEVHLDIDGFTTGVVRGRELYDESGEYSDLHIGDEVQATVLELENESGQMELSFRQAGHYKAWEELERLYKEGTIVKATIVDANRGGLMVKVGRVVGFLPVSQLTTEHYPRVEGGDKTKILEILSTFINQEFNTKIIDINEAEEKLIVSEKAATEEEQKALISKFEVGDVVEGKITGVVDFGAFIEFGSGLEGLIHISEIAWQRIEDPRSIVQVGDTVKAKIIQIDGTKISLSIKRLMEDPWKQAVERYSVGQVVKGKVLKINPFGAFVELDDQIHGLAHISELSHSIVRDPSEVVSVGGTYDFKILSIEAKNHRLGLSIKALKESSKEKANEKAAADDSAAAKDAGEAAATPEAKAESAETGETKEDATPETPA